jgi:hypothetical protein
MNTIRSKAEMANEMHDIQTKPLGPNYRQCSVPHGTKKCGSRRGTPVEREIVEGGIHIFFCAPILCCYHR